MFKCYTEVFNGIEVFILTIQFSALRVVIFCIQQITTEKYIRGFKVSEVGSVPQSIQVRTVRLHFMSWFCTFLHILHQFVYNLGTPVPGINFMYSYRTSCIYCTNMVD